MQNLPKKLDNSAIPSANELLYFAGGSLSLFGIGIALGARYVAKKENFVIGYRSESVRFALRALMYSSVLSLGTFSLGTLIFMQVSGIRSTVELANSIKGKLDKVEFMKPAPDVANDIKEKNKLTLEEELGYWNKLFLAPRSANERAAAELEKQNIEKKEREQEIDRNLSFWERHFDRPVVEGVEKRESLWTKWTKSKDLKSADSNTNGMKTAAESLQATMQNKEANFDAPEFLEEQNRQSFREKYFGGNKNQ